MVANVLNLRKEAVAPENSRTRGDGLNLRLAGRPDGQVS
jgi:hypothetical protein